MEWRGRPRRARRVPAVRRLGTGLSRATRHTQCCQGAASRVATAEECSRATHRLAGQLEGFCAETRSDERLALNARGQLLLLPLAEIHWLELLADTIALHLGKQTVLLSDTCSAVAAKLPQRLFLRVGESMLVNVRQIRGLRRLCQGEWQVLLRNGTRLAPQFELGEAAVLVAKCRRAAPDQIPPA